MQPIAMLGDISLLIYQFIAIPYIVTITVIDGIIVMQKILGAPRI